MSDEEAQTDGLRALIDACERNVPLSVVHCEMAGRAPFANGRLIRLDAEALEVEDLRIIGRDIRFSRGQQLEAYFTLEGVTYMFRTTVQKAQKPVRLNSVMVVKGLTLIRPVSVDVGQRRNAYRVSLAGAELRARAELWRIDQGTPDDTRDDDHEPEPAERKRDSKPAWPDAEQLATAAGVRAPDLTGWLADASDRGLGVILDGHAASKLRVFEVVALRLHLPGAPEPILFPAEVRQVRELKHRAYKVGVVLLFDEMPREVQVRLRRVGEYLSRVQRDELRRRKAS